MNYIKLITITIIVGAIFVSRIIAGDVYFVPGEKKDIWIEISERDGDITSWTIDTGVIWVEDSNRSIVNAKASATIDGRRVYGLVDSTDWAVGSEYSIYILWGTDVTNEIYISPIKAIASPDYL